MADAKDILGVKSGPGVEGHLEKKAKFSREKKPGGVSREVYALTGGLTPLIQTDTKASLKKKSTESDVKISWEWLPFTTSARSDKLALCHWTKVVNGVPPTGDHAYAKYNKEIGIQVYNDEEYALLLQHPRWSQEETDHLFDLCNQFDLRFSVIADRFDVNGRFPERSVEELKDRYYTVTRILMRAKARRGEEVPQWYLSREGFNAEYEVERKKALHHLFSQSRQQRAEEDQILREAMRILDERSKAKSTVAQSDVGVSGPSAGPVGQEKEEPVPEEDYSEVAQIMGSTPLQPVLRGPHFSQCMEKYDVRCGPRNAKKVEQTFKELGGFKPSVPTARLCASLFGMRRDVLKMLELQRKVQSKHNELTQLRARKAQG